MSYDGTDFHGWAVQPGLRTVEGTVTEALNLITGGSHALTVAGRTDAGVHARGQVVHVDVSENELARAARRASDPCQAIMRRLSALLAQESPGPKGSSDVAVTGVDFAPEGFDARFSALSRTYSYRVCDDPARFDPLRRRDVLWLREPLDVEAMDNAARKLTGEHDFISYCKPREGATTVRELLELKVERKGGIVEALKSGYVQEEVAKILADRFKKADIRKDRIVGNNMYPNMTETLLETRTEDTAALKAQRTKDIEAYLSDIDTKHVGEALAAFKADGSVDKGIEAAFAGATIAELMAAVTDGKGAAETVTAIAPHRWSERFEALRRRTEDYKAQKNDNVKIFLANMGPIPQHKARADFTTGFLQVGAFEVLGNDGFKTVEEAAEAAGKSGADAVVICSTDATYPEIVPALAPKLHEVLPNARVFLAGAAPKDLLETYNNAGIDEYISVKANCYEVLERLQKKKGMIA